MRTVLLLDAATLGKPELEAWIDWVRGLGVTPEDVRPEVAIIQTGEGYQLHLEQMERDSNGRTRVDQAANRVATRPLVVELGTERTWPRSAMSTQPEVRPSR